MLPRDAGNEHHTKPDGEDGDGRAEIRLEKYKSEQKECVRTGDQNVADMAYLNVASREYFASVATSINFAGSAG